MDLYSYFYFLVKQIPQGMVSTYGSLARALGDIRAARACGVMLSQNPDPPNIPCHRVVMSDGSLGGFTHPEGLKKKIELLRSEGVEIENGRVKNFRKLLFEDFKTDFPLKKLREEQKKLKKRMIAGDCPIHGQVAGVDVSYSGRMAYGAMVFDDGEVVLVRRKVDFPYIPSYLAYREMPVILELLKKRRPGVLMVDGNGILHPRGFGLASHVGVVANIPTIGVAKTLLVGMVMNNRVIVDGEIKGIYIKSGRKRGIYISPGHCITIEKSVEIVKRYLYHRNPEPLRKAHIYANMLRRGELEP